MEAGEVETAAVFPAPEFGNSEVEAFAGGHETAFDGVGVFGGVHVDDAGRRRVIEVEGKGGGGGRVVG